MLACINNKGEYVLVKTVKICYTVTTETNYCTGFLTLMILPTVRIVFLFSLALCCLHWTRGGIRSVAVQTCFKR